MTGDAAAHRGSRVIISGEGSPPAGGAWCVPDRPGRTADSRFCFRRRFAVLLWTAS